MSTWNNISFNNAGATRNQSIAPRLGNYLSGMISNVFGEGYTAQVYSGGQDWKGLGTRRTGSTRHDGGNAADVYIVNPQGKRLSGDALAPAAQYWLAKGIGGVGLEMRGGGIHLDVHQDRARAWNYAGQGGQYTDAQRKAVAAGMAGQFPEGMANTSPNALALAPPRRVTRPKGAQA